ncbi:hypothetical protein BH11ARM2_BH11ARM2_06860 [soil metagenome]
MRFLNDVEATVDGIVKEAIGPYEQVGTFAHGHGYSQLAQVRSERGLFWVKRHRFPGKQAGEIHALRFWGPKLGRTPEPVAWSLDPMVVVLSHIEGVAPDENDVQL